ncbi:MAG: NADPH-dependent 7-cyano-7-deazaguanine reductase QueF [Epsilonproteobacteria bacterium]|nr:NADPH-dependent 7-cyano-7-deazaguanine reductase QueF [Campylobacterota bacterium]NPA56975.1 NADPH-dependent 7-cyano-7-deazaguanine reductase QueF [Campylobacterota bacterium]
MRYGEKEITEFNPEKDLEVWPNNNSRPYKITITLPEFSCLCPRSGYPDYATFTVEYIPERYVVELKALKLYINSFRNRYISHEDSANEVFTTLYEKLKPRWLRLTADFNPRGNVHTVIEIDSDRFVKETP